MEDQQLNRIISTITKFRDERNWKQFHNGKDLALALSIEAAELNELFLWKNADEAKIEEVQKELADIFIYALFIAEKYGFDVEEIIRKKLEECAQKYPVEKAKGNATKYSEL